MTDPRGFYRKFNVERIDGQHLPGRKHHGCDYFVLDLTHDDQEAVAAALGAYADAVLAKRPRLALDLFLRKVGIERRLSGGDRD